MSSEQTPRLPETNKPRVSRWLFTLKFATASLFHYVSFNNNQCQFNNKISSSIESNNFQQCLAYHSLHSHCKNLFLLILNKITEHFVYTRKNKWKKPVQLSNSKPVFFCYFLKQVKKFVQLLNSKLFCFLIRSIWHFLLFYILLNSVQISNKRNENQLF